MLDGGELTDGPALGGTDGLAEGLAVEEIALDGGELPTLGTADGTEDPGEAIDEATDAMLDAREEANPADEAAELAGMALEALVTDADTDELLDDELLSARLICQT